MRRCLLSFLLSEIYYIHLYLYYYRGAKDKNFLPTLDLLRWMCFDFVSNVLYRPDSQTQRREGRYCCDETRFPVADLPLQSVFSYARGSLPAACTSLCLCVPTTTPLPLPPRTSRIAGTQTSPRPLAHRELERAPRARPGGALPPLPPPDP